MESTLRYSSEEIAQYPSIIDQYNFRKKAILATLKKKDQLSELSAVCGLDGLLRPIEGGTYSVNDAMIEDLKKVYAGQHASNLGGFPAKEITQSIKPPAFIVDPVVVDELAPLAHFSGLLPWPGNKFA